MTTELKPVLFADAILKAIYEALGDLIPTVEAGGQIESVVIDMTARNLLGQILMESKITNTHLAMLTENEVSEEDVLL